MGQTMCDMHLNDPDQIVEAIKNMRNESKSNSIKQKVRQIEGSLFDMVTQNNPFSEAIKEQSQLGVEDYLIVSRDFNFKSQIMRSLEINATQSYYLMLENIFKINKRKYAELLEHDLYKIMEKDDMQEIFEFFDISKYEFAAEQSSNDKNLHCNFEFTLTHDHIPTIWNESGTTIPMNKFRDPQNQNEEIVHRLANIAADFSQEDIKIEVRHQCVDFQKVTLGEKIRQIYMFIDLKEDCDVAIHDHFCLSNFQFEFDDLYLATMMHVGDKNKEFYALETVQQIVDGQFDTSKTFYKNLFIFYIATFILPIVI